MPGSGQRTDTASPHGHDRAAVVVHNGCMVPGPRRIAPVLVASAAAVLAGGTAILVASCSTQATQGTRATTSPSTSQEAPATQGAQRNQPPPASGPWIAPYDYLAAGGPSPAEVMKTTGIRRFTLAFIVSDGACQPVWDNGDPLTGAAEEAAIGGIRSAGGQVTVSVGGNGGTKLGLTCTSPQALAGVPPGWRGRRLFLKLQFRYRIDLRVRSPNWNRALRWSVRPLWRQPRWSGPAAERNYPAAPAPSWQSRTRTGEPALASRISQLESQVRRLLACPQSSLEEADQAPAGPGVLLLSDSDQVTHYYIEACQTLRIGVGNLLRGGRGSEAVHLKERLAENLGIAESRVPKYLKDHCAVRWLQLDEGARELAHFAIAVLRPAVNE